MCSVSTEAAFQRATAKRTNTGADAPALPGVDNDDGRVGVGPALDIPCGIGALKEMRLTVAACVVAAQRRGFACA